MRTWTKRMWAATARSLREVAPWIRKLCELGIRKCNEKARILKSGPLLLGCKLGTVASR
jgi:hypothetical protein